MQAYHEASQATVPISHLIPGQHNHSTSTAPSNPSILGLMLFRPEEKGLG
jgi:hypothetical protein